MKKMKSWFSSVASTAMFEITALYGAYNRHRYLAKATHAVEQNEKLLMKLVHKNRDTEFGRRHHFDEINSVKDYQRLVPYTHYPDYQEYIDRMVQTGEQGLITSETINYLSNTSGTVGVTKRIPSTKASNNAYVKAISISLWMVRQELKRRGYKYPHGRGINLVETHSVKTPGGIRNGYVSGNALSSIKLVAPLITPMPKEFYDEDLDVTDAKHLKALYALKDPDLEFMFSVFISALTDLMDYIVRNHETLIHDIETGTISPTIEIPNDLRSCLQNKLTPDPERARELRRIFESPDEGPIIPRLWKRMSMVNSIASGEFAPYLTKMRSYTGDDMKFCYLIYGSSEALVASTMEPEIDRYLILPDTGFYEFIAVGDKDEKPLCMNQLKEGNLYEIVITNLAGLWRYRIHDVVRVAGFEGETPYLRFAYRDQQVINIAGVHLNAEHMNAAAKWLGQEIGQTVVDYSFYEDSSVTPARIVFFIEFENDPEQRELGPLMDRLINKANDDYGHQLESDSCSPCVVHILPHGTYTRLRDEKIKNGVAVNQIKNVKLIRDNAQYRSFLDAAQALK